jgi:hypothetical protein
MRTVIGLFGATVGAAALMYITTAGALFHWESVQAGLIGGAAPALGGWLLAQLSLRLYGSWQSRKRSS